MATVPRVKKVHMNITEANNGQKYFGVLITPREDFFTKTTSPILVDGKETNDSDVAKYITDYLERTRFPNSEPIWFFRIIPVQWLMLEAITHCSGEEGLRVSRLTGLKIPAVALKWEGNEHAQTKRINRIFHLKAFRQKVDERWLTYLEPAFLNVLQEFEFRHAPVIRCMLTHGFRLDRPPKVGEPLRDMLVGQFDYADSKLPEDPGYDLGDARLSSPGPPMPSVMVSGGWQLQ